MNIKTLLPLTWMQLLSTDQSNSLLGVIEIIHGQLDIKLGFLLRDELYIVLSPIKSREAAGLYKITPDV